MPEKNVDILPAVPEISSEAKIGYVALVLEQAHQQVEINKQSIMHGNRKRRILDFTDELIASLQDEVGHKRPKSKEITHQGEDELKELTFMAQGMMERESALAQGIGINEVKARKRRAKIILGSKTKHDTVVEAVQQGFVPVQIEETPFSSKLSPIEEAVLFLTARGITAEEIGQKYGITQNTIDRYFESLRLKLGAKNMAHVMLRAFETGIFKAGKEIPDPTKIYEDLRIDVLGKITSPIDIGIVHPNELEFLRLLGKHGRSSFTQEDIIALGFYPDGHNSENSAFGHMVKRTMAKLEADTGQEVVVRRKIRSNNGRKRVFYFKLPVLIGVQDDMKEIPAYEPPKKMPSAAEIARRNSPRKRAARKRITKSKKRPKRKEVMAKPKNIPKITSPKPVELPEIEQATEPEETNIEPERTASRSQESIDFWRKHADDLVNRRKKLL